MLWETKLKQRTPFTWLIISGQEIRLLIKYTHQRKYFVWGNYTERRKGKQEARAVEMFLRFSNYSLHLLEKNGCPQVGWSSLTFTSKYNAYCWWWFSCQAVSNSCDPMDCSLPGSSVHGISQARILEWVAIPFSGGIFLTRGSNLLCLLHWVTGSLPLAPPGKPDNSS